MKEAEIKLRKLIKEEIKNIITEKQYTDKDISTLYHKATDSLLNLYHAFLNTDRKDTADKVYKLKDQLNKIFLKF